MSRNLRKGCLLALSLLTQLLLCDRSSAGGGTVGLFDPADLRPGMHGRAYTVFEGDEAQGFPVEILGVTQGTRPKGDLVLFRAIGDSLARTGIVAGMSGSPVYVDGKILGAIAFAFPFSKEPIGMITPIQEMLAGLDRLEDPPGPWMGTPGRLHERFRSAFLSRSCAADLWDLLVPETSGSDGAHGLIALTASGWAPDLRPALDRFARRAGLPLPISASVGGAGAVGRRDLRPGSAMGVRLIEGDASLAAIGTVTYVDSDRIVAFGHPLFQGGPVELPMTNAWIHTIIPSFNVPFKMGSAGETIGTIRQDLRAGVTGIVGEKPSMLPVRVAVDGPAGSTTYRYRTARGLLLEPLLVSWAATNSFLHHGWRIGHADLRTRLSVHFNGGQVVVRNDRLASKIPAGELAEQILVPIPLLLTNPFEPVTIDSVALEVSYRPKLEETELIAVRAGRERIRAGERMELTARLQDRQGTLREVPIEVPIPERWAGGTLLIMAGGIEALTEWDRERAPSVYVPTGLMELVRLIAELPSAGILLVRIYSEQDGVILGDREVGPLPGSVTRVLGTRNRIGSARGAPNAILDELRVDVGAVVSGRAAIRVVVE